MAEARTATEPLKIPTVSLIMTRIVAVALEMMVAFRCNVMDYPHKKLGKLYHVELSGLFQCGRR